jgi:hypothetical protein
MKSTLILLLAVSFFALPNLTRAEEAETLVVSEFTFKYGKPWIRQQVTSSMRAGQLTYDHADEKLADIDLVIYFFGQGQGGGIQANLDRWVGQFEGTPESKIEEKEMSGRKVSFLTAKGTYMDSMGGPFSGNKEAKTDHMMLAAILPSDQGAVFLKLTGPQASVEAMMTDFEKFAASPFAE